MRDFYSMIVFCFESQLISAFSLIHLYQFCGIIKNKFNNNNNNNNNIYLLQLGCHPVAVVILHVYKT